MSIAPAELRTIKSRITIPKAHRGLRVDAGLFVDAVVTPRINDGSVRVIAAERILSRGHA